MKTLIDMIDFNVYLIEGEWCLYVSVKHTDIGANNGLSPVLRQAIIFANAAILSIRHQGTYFSETLFKI